MTFLFWPVYLLFLLTSLVLIAVVLLQEPKQSGLGEGLGGGGGQDFGNVRGTAGGLHRLTIWLGIIWGLAALALAVVPRV